jgi:hypothetical protein
MGLCSQSRLPLDPLRDPHKMLSDSRHATVETMIDVTVSRDQSNFGLERRPELLVLFFNDIPRFVVGLVHVIHGTVVASRGGRWNTTKGFPDPG